MKSPTLRAFLDFCLVLKDRTASIGSKHLLVGFRAVAIAALAMGLRAQDSFSSPLNTQNMKTSVSSDGLVSIINGPGQVDFRMPLGPGLHSRGLSFDPVAKLRTAQRLVPQDGGGGSTIWASGGSRYTDHMSPLDISTLGAATDSASMYYVVSDTMPTGLPNSYGLLYSHDGQSGWPGDSLINSNGLFWGEAAYTVDMGMARGVDPGFATVAHDRGTANIFLPTGEVVRVLSVIGLGSFPGAQTAECIVDPTAYSGLLAQFGYSTSNLDGSPCMRGTGGALVFPLLGTNGQDPVMQDQIYMAQKYPGRLLVIKDGTAYEYQFLGVLDQHGDPGTWGPDGEPGSPSGYVYDSMCYSLAAIRNRFGDSIQFTHGANSFDYTADLYVNGAFTGQRIQMTLDQQTNATTLVPDLNWVQAQASAGPALLQAGLIKNGVIHIKYLNGAAVASSYRIDAVLDDASICLNWTGGWDTHSGPGQMYLRDYLQFQDIQDESTGYTISFNWQWSGYHIPWGGRSGSDVAITTLASVQMGNQERVSFQYQAGPYRDTDSMLPWESVSWGVSSVTRADLVSGVTRTTTYQRLLPQATNYTLPSVPLQWTQQNSWEAETSPDGSTLLRRFYPANGQADWNAEAQSEWIASNYAPAQLYKSGLAFEERYYAPGVDWHSDLANDSASTTAYRIVFHDGWDGRSLFPIPTSDNPYGLVTLETLNDGHSKVFDSDKFYPTRTIDWDKDLGVARVQLAYNWDPYSSQWPDLHQVTIQTSDPWTDLGYHYDRFSDASIGVGTYGSAVTFPSGAIDRLDQTTYRPLDGWFVVGDWTGKNFTQNGVQRLPVISRSSIQSNGVTQSQTVGATVTKQYAYPSDNTGVPSSMTLTGAGLPGSGQVGFNYGYDATYNLNSITSLSPVLTTQQTVDMLGHVTSVKDPNGFTYHYGWDTLDRITTVTPPGNEVPTSFTYGSDFRSATISRGSGQENRYYNAFGELVRETRLNPNGSLSHRNTGYDLVGRRTWQTIWQSGPGTDTGWDSPNPPTAASGSGTVPSTLWSYDYRDRVTQSVAPTGEVQAIAYSGLTRTVTENPGGAQSAVTVFRSDPLGRLASVTDALSQTTSYSYDTADRPLVVTQTDPATNATQTRSWTYDGLGRLTSLRQPESGTTTYGTFTVTGKPTVTVYGAGSASPLTVTTTFDGLDRVQSVTSNDGSVNQSFTYDETGHGSAAGKLTDAVSNGVTKSLTYSGLNGRLSSLTRGVDSRIFTLGLGYDNYGNVISRTYPDGKIQTITYDLVRGLPSVASFNGANLATLAYDSASWLLTGLTAGNNGSSVFGYTNERLSSLIHFIPGQTLASWTFQYDPRGNLATDGEDAYSYDLLNRLVLSYIRDPQDTLSTDGLRQAVAYDAFGNRSSLNTQRVTNWTGMPVPSPPAVSSLSAGDTRGLQSYAMSSSEKASMAMTNHLPSTLSGVMTGAAYDAQGNLTSLWPTPGSSSGQLTMSYDALGRLSSMADAKRGLTEKYSYDDEGLRIMVEVWQGSTLQSKKYMIYNESRQLVSEYDLVLE